MCLLREEVVFDPVKKSALEKLVKLDHKQHSVETVEDIKPPLSGAVQSYRTCHVPCFKLCLLVYDLTM